MTVANHRADTFEAIVIGAGVAGLAAARTLAEAGRRVALIEARERVGGRIHTVQAIQGDLPVELGAEFIHGLPEELIDLVDEAGLTRFELDGDSRCVSPGRGAGRLEACGDQHEVHQLFEELGQVQLSPDSRDLSFSDFVGQAETWTRGCDVGDELCRRIQCGRGGPHQRSRAGQTAGGGRRNLGGPFVPRGRRV